MLENPRSRARTAHARRLQRDRSTASANACPIERRSRAPGGAARHDHGRRLAAGEPIGAPAVRVAAGAILGWSLRARCAVEQSREIPRRDPPPWRKHPVAAGPRPLLADDHAVTQSYFLLYRLEH